MKYSGNLVKTFSQMNRYITILFFSGLCGTLAAQTLTEQDAVLKTLSHYPEVQIANQDARMQQALERTAFNPPQPELTFEFPGDDGIGFEFQQQFDFPGVYTSRSRWLQSQTRYKTEAANITKQELMRDVRLNYLEAQATQALVRIFSRQDSLWNEIEVSTQRLFEGGQINRGDFLYASSQAGILGNSLAQIRIDATQAISTLSLYTGEQVTEVDDLRALPFTEFDTTGGFYFERYQTEGRQVAERELAVKNAARLPGFLIGYLRTPDRDTDYRYRFNAGVTIPLWQGQYKGEVDAARVAMETLEMETELHRAQAQTKLDQLLQTLEQTRNALIWFESTSLPQTEELVTTYRRLYEGGEVDYALTLRNIAETLDIRIQYIETLKRYNQSIIELEFLAGE